MPRALIVGHTGQDGRILWDQLAERGFSLVGVSRNSVRGFDTAWDEAIDIADASAVQRLICGFKPDQIYYLAAHHHSSQDRTSDATGIWNASLAVHATAFQHVMEAVRLHQPSARVFYAASSRVFGEAAASPQNEATPLRPTCIYGATKVMGMTLADFYRRNHGVFASSGILFNHESPLRGGEFVSQRIVQGLVRIKRGQAATLQIGNLGARVDWGYAPDYTRAMQLILDAGSAGDFVIASGQTHSVRDMIETAAEFIGLRWENTIVENPGILQRPSQELRGDSSLLRHLTGWTPGTSFREMIRIMVEAAEGEMAG
jgi:GDPmannose 4,6-dehydratase